MSTLRSIPDVIFDHVEKKADSAAEQIRRRELEWKEQCRHWHNFFHALQFRHWDNTFTR